MSAASSVIPYVREVARDLLAELEEVDRLIGESGDDEHLYRRAAEALDCCLARLSGLAIWGPENRLPSSELWSAAGHVLARGWLQNRARTKPRGYAGDYEMLARIYEQHLCDDPLGRLFDRYFQEQAAPRAVRNRMQMMIDWISEAALARRAEPRGAYAPRSPDGDRSPLRVAIIGSAFGLEVRDALQKLDEADRKRLHVTLLDLDPDAIDFARGRLAALLAPEQLTARSANLFRLAERPELAALLDQTHLMFCPGMFDYLDDAAAAAMLRVLYDRLAPGGRLTVFQFASHNPTRAYMEWMANWYLIYRDDKQIRSLVQEAGIPSNNAEYGAEPLGVDLCLTLRHD